MKEKILRLEIIGTFFIIVLGSLLHFTFEWSKRFWLVGAFSAVNESTWEHLKLAVMPAFLWMLIEMKLIKERPENFFFAKTKGIYAMPFFIVLIFYSYKAILGKNFLVLDILTFMVAVILGQIITYQLMFWKNLPKIYNKIVLIFLFLLVISFLIFTFYSPHNFLFQDPINLNYGI